jgi:hypothetical protein
MAPTNQHLDGTNPETFLSSLFSCVCSRLIQVAKISIKDKLAPNITLQAQIDERRCICIKQHGSDKGPIL